MAYWRRGQKIQEGRYVIDRVLGSGGAGVTYRAIDQLSGQLVAIKTLNAEIQARVDFQKHQERFIQEAFRLAKCSHPHVIKVNDVFQERELWCMAMEYISGGTLGQYAQHKGILSESEGLRYIQQIGAALAYVHQQGFLHRDVKPGNVMLHAKTLQAVLIDFGLAREFVQDKIQIHTNSRTESFAPIEQYEMKAKRGAYTDVYALAATLYFIVTLQLPFPAQFRQQGINLIPPKQHNPKLSEQVNSAIMKGMELLPEYRPQSMQEWLDLLNFDGIPSFTPQSTDADIFPVSSPPSTPRPPISSPPSTPRPPISPPPPAPPPQVITPPAAEPSRIFSQYSTKRSYYQISQADQKTETYHPSQPSQPNPVKTEILQEISLLSEVGMDYTQLRDLLKLGKWKEADQQTAKLFLMITKREKAGWLDVIHIQRFPCQDLQTLDQLWLTCSNGKFGFSVQKRIYEQLGGTPNYNSDVWRKFGDKVGWRKGNSWLPYKDLNFNLWAPEGHLPMLGMQIWGSKGWIGVIAARLIQCEE